jgi:hypothetical protein
MLMKFAGWNVLRAAASEKLREKLEEKRQKRTTRGHNTGFGFDCAIRMTATVWLMRRLQRFQRIHRAGKRPVGTKSHSEAAA